MGFTYLNPIYHLWEINQTVLVLVSTAGHLTINRGNIIWKNGVHHFCTDPETIPGYTVADLAHVAAYGGPRHIMLFFPLIFHLLEWFFLRKETLPFLL